MYHLKMEKQMSNAKSVRMPTLPELSDDNKRSPLLPQVQANNQVNNHSTPDRSTTTLGNKHLQHWMPLSNDATMTHLVPTEYAQETSSRISSVMALKFTTLHKPTWEPLLPP
jgi:hypothetical protein